MMQRITALFVNRPPLVFVLVALITLAGIFALSTIVQQQFPNIDFPTVNVSASYPGASPSELRDAIVRPLEDAIAGAPNLDHIQTSIQQNNASISATFTLDSNHTTDLTEIQNRIQTARSALPADLPAPSVRSFDPAQATIVTLSVTSATMNITTLSSIITNSVVPAIEQVDGVSNVGANGTVTPAIEVIVDPQKLSSFGFTANDVASSIQANNVRAPGGIAYLGNRETSIDVRGDIQSAKTVANLPILGSTAVLKAATSPSGTVTTKFTGATGSTNQALALGSSATSGAGSTSINPFSSAARLPTIGNVAIVSDSYEAKRVISYVNGKQQITLNIQKATGASEVAASKSVLAALPAITRQYPAIDFNIINVQADQTEAQLWGVLQTLLEGILFTGIAMVFFLRSWRNALVIMIAIPTSLFVTFFFMRVFGFTIDTVSLLAMTLIIGILVDDSIVVLENIERHFEDGEAPRTAAILGRAEIGPAAVVITLVDVVVFLPIAFLPGQTGRFLGEFGIVVTIATLTSLIVSFTITPALAGNWSLRSGWKPPGFINAFTRGFNWVREFYATRVLAGALNFGWLVAIASAALTAGAIALVFPLGLVGFEFIPAVDAGQVFVSVQFPTGTPLTTTDAAIITLTNAALQSIPDVDRITSTTGTAQAGFGGGIALGSTGQLRVLLKPDHKEPTARIAFMLNAMGAKLVPGARVTAIQATGTRGGNSQPIDVTVSTTRGEPDAYAEQVLGVLMNTEGTTNVNSSALRLSPQIDIQFDRDRARALDLDIGSASTAVRSAFGGTLATQFDTVNGTKYVQVLYPTADQTSLAQLRAITLRTRTGAIVHLGDVAILQNNPSQSLITRVNRQTVIHISANVAQGVAQSTVQAAFLKNIKALHLPNTVVIGAAPGGNQQNLALTVQGLGVSLILSFALVYLLMVGLYDAYRAPLVIMFSVPVASIGAFGGLALTHQTLNLFSLIGVVMLVGLVSKNGILLVDFAHHKVLAGMDKLTAIEQAAKERFRPIVMTTVSMISGMMPLALALDPGSAAKRSLGTVVIGGLTSSLILTLVLIPVVYMWIAPGPPAEPAPEFGRKQPTHTPSLTPLESR